MKYAALLTLILFPFAEAKSQAEATLAHCEDLIKKANEVYTECYYEDERKRHNKQYNPGVRFDARKLNSLIRQSSNQFRNILKQCSKDAVTTRSGEQGCDCDTVSIHLLAYSRLANIAEISGNYRAAINILDSIRLIYPDKNVYLPYSVLKGPLHGMIDVMKARLYRDHLGSAQAAIALYQEVIKSYVEEEVVGFESYEPITWLAFDEMDKLLVEMRADNNLMNTQYQLAYDQASTEIVKVESLVRLADILFERRKFDEGVKKLRDNIKLYPDVRFSSHYIHIDFSAGMVERIFKALYDQKKVKEETLHVLDQIYNENVKTNEVLAVAAQYYKCLVADLDNDPPSVVIKSYETFLGAITPTYESSSKILEYNGLVTERLLEIKGHPETKVEFVADEVNIYSRADSSSNVTVSKKVKGQSVTIQYRSQTNRNWYKVKVGDKLFAWVHLTAFRKIEVPFFLKGELYSSWPGHRGNADGTRFVEGSRIETPRVIALFENVCTWEPLLYDVNNDRIPELIIDGQVDPATGKEETVCIDGTVPKILWKTTHDETCNVISKSTIRDGKLYKAGGTYDILDGKLLDHVAGGGAYGIPTKPGVFWVWNNRLYTDHISSKKRPVVEPANEYKGKSIQAAVFTMETDLVTDDKIIQFIRNKANIQVNCLDIRSKRADWTVTQETKHMISFTGIYNNEIILCSYDLDAPRLSDRDFTHISVYSMTDGKLIRKMKLDIVGTIMMVKDRLIIVNGGTIYSFDPQTGNLQWHASAGPIETHYGNKLKKYSVCAVGNTLYLGSTDGNLYCFDIITGTPLWKHNLGRSIHGAISAAGQVLAVKTDSDILYIIGK